jgi:transposase
MGVPQLLDVHFPTHGNWDGLSFGWTATIWLVHILSQADHRLNQVQDWVAQHLETFSRCTGQPIYALNFSDDRLATILRRLNEESPWEAYEQNQGKHLIRVYELASMPVRLDTTTASTYQAPTFEGLFQQGHSKDHRPDLAQVKIMLRRKDPLGLPLATQVVDGSRADDPLYEPTIKPVRATLNRPGVLYVGDSKMAAERTRASIQDNNDYYLMPLPATIVPQEVLDTYLKPVWEGTQLL